MDRQFTLSNELTIPSIGFGTWQLTPDETAEVAVTSALEVGYRHIDTAKVYGNEIGVGRAIKKSGIPREEIFVTTKLWGQDQPYDKALKAFDASLEKLGMEYVDLYLIHWPTENRQDAWRALRTMYKSGRAKSIGVSNYTIRHLEDLQEESDMMPMVNQVEFHPFIYDSQKALLAYCKERNILVEAYSPLVRHTKVAHPTVVKVAEKIGKTPAQVVLRWCLQLGTAPLPRSTNVDHMKENFEIFDFELDVDAVRALCEISDGERVTSDPEHIE